LENQQRRPIVSIDFIAGLIVGEGSYGLNVHRPKQNRWEIKPCFSLRMNDEETIALVCEAFAHYGLALYRSPNIYHGCHTIRVDGLQRVRAHLAVFLPRLTGKKLKAATILSEFIEHRLTLPPKSKMNDMDVDFIERLREVNGPSAKRIPIGTLRDYTRSPDMRGKHKRRVKI
jgi:hypothetical protein